MKRLICLLGILMYLGCDACRAETKGGDAKGGDAKSADTKAEEPLAYKFNKNEAINYGVTITSTVMTEKASGNKSTQTTKQELVIEEKIVDVDKTGSAEIQITFKSAKMDIKISSGADREPKPPDTLKYFAGRSVTVQITADGEVLAVRLVPSIVSAAKEAAKDPALMELIDQTYGEDFFKELIQNLHPRFPLDTEQMKEGWKVITDIPIARTAYKLRVTTKSSLGRVEGGVAHILMDGNIKEMPVDPEAPKNEAAPVVNVLASSITGDAQFQLDKGAMISSSVEQRMTLRTRMLVKPPGRGAPVSTEGVTKSTTAMTVKRLK